MKLLLCVFSFVCSACMNGAKPSVHEEKDVVTSESKDTMSTVVAKDLGPWTIDLNKSYPKVDEVVLQDMTEVDYIPIETNDSMLWRGRDIVYLQKDLLIAANDYSGIMVYDGQGKALHSFNRKGNGPEEWTGISRVCYDRKADDLFILDMAAYRILVYDLKGNFKRSFRLPYVGAHYLRELVDFGPDELLAYVADNEFVRLSKKDGTILEKKDVRRGKGDLRLWIEYEDNYMATIYTDALIPSAEGGYLAAAYTLDTLYRITPGNVWIPVGTRTPQVTKTDPLEFVRPLFDTPRYSFVFSVKRMWNREADTGFPTTTYRIDKTNHQIHEVEKVTDANAEGSDRLIDFCEGEDVWVSVYYPEALLDALEKGRLKGKLKEIATKLHPEDNPVVMVCRFK